MKSMAACCAGSCGTGRLLWVTLSVLGLSGPATDCFPGMPGKEQTRTRAAWPVFLLSLTKSAFRPSVTAASGQNRQVHGVASSQTVHEKQPGVNLLAVHLAPCG